MTCKNCIHDKLCDMWAVESGLPFVNPNTCEHFKNKADYVEVVHCVECKKWKVNPNNLYGGYCRHCEGASIDHFCSYGERK